MLPDVHRLERKERSFRPAKHESKRKQHDRAERIRRYEGQRCPGCDADEQPPPYAQHRFVERCEKKSGNAVADEEHCRKRALHDTVAGDAEVIGERAVGNEHRSVDPVDIGDGDNGQQRHNAEPAVAGIGARGLHGSGRKDAHAGVPGEMLGGNFTTCSPVGPPNKDALLTD